MLLPPPPSLKASFLPHLPDARDLVPGMDDRGSLALRAGQDDVHKVARRGHGLDLLEIVHHHGCWLAGASVNIGVKKEGRKGWVSCFVRSSPLSLRVAGQGEGLKEEKQATGGSTTTRARRRSACV